MSTPTDNRDHQNYAASTCYKISWSPWLDMPTRPSNTYLPYTPTSLQITQTKMWAVQESITEGKSRNNYTWNSHSNTIFNTSRCHHGKHNMPSMQTQPSQRQLPSLQPRMLQLQQIRTFLRIMQIKAHLMHKQLQTKQTLHKKAQQ